MKHLIPLHDNIILKPAGKQEKIGALLVPQQHQKRLSRGTIVDIAPGCSKQLKLGDEVTYNLHSETPIDVDGQEFVVISESQCIAIVREVTDHDSNEVELKLAK